MAIEKSETAKTEAPEISERDLFVSVFGTPNGKKVLELMVRDLHVFDSIAPGDTEEIAMRNYGLSLLAVTGVFDDDEDNDPIARLCSFVH